MAPAPPMGRDRAIALVAAGELPFSMGSPHPIVMVLEEDGRFRIRELVVDPVALRRLQHDGRTLTPEDYWALGVPTGEIHADAATRTELLELMATMPWPASW